jgi:hypothetical protein
MANWFDPWIEDGGGGGDATPPTITIVSPDIDDDPGNAGAFSADWEIARMTPIVLEITDAAPGIEYACLVCRYPGAVDEITVYRRGAFRGQFLGLSSVITDTGTTLRLSILPLNGWPSSDAVSDIVFDVDVVDSDGNLAA